METLLVKMFATALALSQVTITPDAVKTQFDRDAGPSRRSPSCCSRLRPYAQGLRPRGHQSRRPDRHRARRPASGRRRDQGVSRHQLCRSANRLSAVLQERARSQRRRSTSATSSPSTTRPPPICRITSSCKGLKLPGASVVLDRKGDRFAEVFEENQRRVWVALADIPEYVQNAFIAAEDKRFSSTRASTSAA